MKRVAFKTIGCRLNQAETASMAASFEQAGYAIVPYGEACDVCVVHTCTITANAEKTCVRAARHVRSDSPHPIIVMAGCAAEVDPEALKQASGADLVVGQDAKFEIPLLLQEHLGVKLPDRPAETTPPLPRFGTTRALVKLQDGCNFHCAYCIVPHTRGAPVSRPFNEVVEELRRLGDAGYREVVLTGANIGCYCDGSHHLPDVIRAAHRLESIDRIRLSSVELSTVETDIVDLMSELPKLCHFLHIPLQSGDDTVLAAMGRRYRRTDYRRFVDYAVERIPHIGLGTDIITGFPGESDEAFQNTCELVQELPFSNLHVFPYSIRQGTRAADMKEQIPRRTKKSRVTRLVGIGAAKREHFARSFVGAPVSVLVERVDEHGMARGWTAEYLEARIESTPARVNDIITGLPYATDGAILKLSELEEHHPA